jgi:transposase-like protein
VARTGRDFSAEFRETAAREVVENSRAITAVARELGIQDTTLGNWVRAYKKKRAGDEAPVSLSDRARLRELERENRELRQKVAFLEKVSAYFASGQR